MGFCIAASMLDLCISLLTLSINALSFIWHSLLFSLSNLLLVLSGYPGSLTFIKATLVYTHLFTHCLGCLWYSSYLSPIHSISVFTSFFSIHYCQSTKKERERKRKYAWIAYKNHKQHTHKYLHAHNLIRSSCC